MLVVLVFGMFLMSSYSYANPRSVSLCISLTCSANSSTEMSRGIDSFIRVLT